MGTGRPYISSATIDASARNVSAPAVRIAAGAAPARTASRNTAVVVLEPLVNGIASTWPAAFWPESGCRRSMISPVAAVVAAPEAQRLVTEKQWTLCFAGYHGATPEF